MPGMGLGVVMDGRVWNESLGLWVLGVSGYSWVPKLLKVGCHSLWRVSGARARLWSIGEVVHG